MEDLIYKILFWLVSGMFTVVIIAGWFFITNWVKRIDANFEELFTSFKYFALKSDLDSTEKDVRHLHDIVIELKAKIENCKNCKN